MRSLSCAAVILLLLGLAPLPPCHAQIAVRGKENRFLERNGLDAVLPLALLTGRPADQAALRNSWHEVNKPSETVTLESVRRCAAKAGINVVSARWPLGKIRERGGVAILSLKEPQSFALLIAMDDKEALLMNGAEETFVSRAVLQKRYSGVCLVPASASVSISDNPLVIDKPLYLIEATGGDIVLNANVEMRNRGRVPLGIKVSTETCSCYGAQPRLSVPSIAPGSTASLTIPIRSRMEGTESATVVLSTSDPAFPQAVLNVRVSSSEVVAALPNKLQIDAKEGAPWSNELSLKLPKKAKIKRMYARKDFVRLKSVSDKPPINSSSPVFRVTCPADTPGEISDEIVFELTGAEVPRIVVPVTGRIHPDIVASPPQLFLGEVKQGVVLIRTVTLGSASGKPFHVWGITPSDPRITVTPVSRDKRKSHEVTITIRLDSDDTIFQQEVALTVGHWRKCVIPVTAMVTGIVPKKPDAQVPAPTR